MASDSASRRTGTLTTCVGVFVALVVTLLGGWFWGASGREDVVRALRATEARNDLLEARASLLGARVSLCDADFGAVSRQLENARGLVGRAGVRLGTLGLNDGPQQLNLAGFHADIDEAQRLADGLVAGAAPVQSRRAGVPYQP
jgi:hypothetical protein